MRALSLWQPWAHAVVHLGKRIENRQWRGCSYRGPFLIHAAKGYGTRNEFENAVETILGICEPQYEEALARPFAVLATRGKQMWEPSPDLQRGGIVGCAWLDGVVQDEVTWAKFARENADHERQRSWWFGGFALVLRDVIQLPFRQWKGEQGWFDVPWARPVMSGDGSRLLGVDWSEP